MNLKIINSQNFLMQVDDDSLALERAQKKEEENNGNKKNEKDNRT